MSQNVLEKTHPITLDKERNLKFCNLSFEKLEDKYGSLDGAMKEFEESTKKGSFKVITTFVWAGLIHEDENLTERQVAVALNPRTTFGLTNVIMEAIQEALPQKAGGDEKNQLPAPKGAGGNGTGSTTSEQ